MNTERELLKRALNYIAHRPKNESLVQLEAEIINTQCELIKAQEYIKELAAEHTVLLVKHRALEQQLTALQSEREILSRLKPIGYIPAYAARIIHNEGSWGAFNLYRTKTDSTDVEVFL